MRVDVPDLIFGDRDRPPLPPASHLVSHIVGIGSGIEMGRVGAGLVVASVKDLPTDRDWSVVDLIGNPMCTNHS